MASASQQFCLKWNDFRSKVTSAFNDLRHDEELVDMTLCCDGQKIRVHRMMLSASSPYFKELLRDTQHQHPMVFLKDVSFADLSAVVEFVYRGEVNVSQQKLNSFLKTAEMLQVRGLTGEEDKVSESSQDVGVDETFWSAAGESAGHVAASTPQPIFSPPYQHNQQPRQQQQRHLRPLDAPPSRRPLHVAPATPSPVQLPPEVPPTRRPLHVAPATPSPVQLPLEAPPSRRPSQMALSAPSPTQLPLQLPTSGFKREPAEDGQTCGAEESPASGSSSAADGTAICRSPQQAKRPRSAVSPALSLPASLGSPQPLAAPPYLVKQERPDYDEDDGGSQEQLVSMTSPLPAAYSTGYPTAHGLPSPHQQRQRPFGAIQRPRLPNVTGAVSGSSSSPSAASSSDIPRPMQPGVVEPVYDTRPPCSVPVAPTRSCSTIGSEHLIFPRLEFADVVLGGCGAESGDLPLESMDQLMEVELKLQDSAFFSNMVLYISRLGGGYSDDDAIRDVMSALLCPAVALEFNLTGVRGKRPFNSLRLYDAVMDYLAGRPLELHKKWVCGTCGRRYLEKAYLVSHEKMHSGETVCPVCSKVFSTKGNLTLHLQRVHKVQQQPIEERVYIPNQRQHQQQ